MSEVKFTKSIIGSPNGIIVKEYTEGQIIDDAELGEYLKTVWTEAKIIVPVDAKEDADGKDGKDGKGKEDKELTEEEIGQLVYDAIEILEKQETVSEEDVAKLKEIGISLKIEGMISSKKPQTILDKVNAYLDEYLDKHEVPEDENEEVPEDENDEIPEEK